MQNLSRSYTPNKNNPPPTRYHRSSPMTYHAGTSRRPPLPTSSLSPLSSAACLYVVDTLSEHSQEYASRNHEQTPWSCITNGNARATLAQSSSLNATIFSKHAASARPVSGVVPLLWKWLGLESCISNTTRKPLLASWVTIFNILHYFYYSSSPSPSSSSLSSSSPSSSPIL